MNVFILKMEGVQAFSTARKAIEYVKDLAPCNDDVYDENYEAISFQDTKTEKLITLLNSETSIEECGGDWSIDKERVQ